MWLLYWELQVNATGESWAEVNRMERVRNQVSLPWNHDHHHHYHNNNNNTSTWTEYLIFFTTVQLIP